jgi:SAM-dependent methyltransferase
MAFEYEDVRMILESLARLDRRDHLLVLGDAVVHFGPDDLGRLAKETNFQLASRPAQLDPFTLGEALGFAHTETLDVNGRATLTFDLHKELPDDLAGRFDCVIDAGVLFWCSDPAAALRNIARMLCVDGLIVHISAVTGHFGRGYWDVHPLLFEDFYLPNGFEFVRSSMRPKFRPHGFLARFAHRLPISNRVTYSDRPGNVYLKQSRFNQIAFTNRFAAGGEANLLPNNVLGVYVFQKRIDQPLQMPVRTGPYSAEESAA